MYDSYIRYCILYSIYHTIPYPYTYFTGNIVLHSMKYYGLCTESIYHYIRCIRLQCTVLNIPSGATQRQPRCTRAAGRSSAAEPPLEMSRKRCVSHRIQCPAYGIHRTACSVKRAAYSAWHIVHSVLCIACSALCTVHSVQCVAQYQIHKENAREQFLRLRLSMHMYVCMPMYLHLYVHMYMYKYAYMHMSHVHVCVFACVYVFMRICVGIRYTYYVQVYACVYVCVQM